MFILEKVNAILNNSTYKEYLNKLAQLEKDRIFCKHNMEHFLDMARIAYIMVLEEGLSYSKEIIYAIGLLHDIGRVKQYEEGISHEEAGYEISKDILKETGFTKDECAIILEGIKNHRNSESNDLNSIIYKSDKLSRRCFDCKASKECNWDMEKRNLEIKY